jgi:hypothetical protein
MYQNIAKLEKYAKCSGWISLNKKILAIEIQVPNMFKCHSIAYLITLKKTLM